MRRVSIIFFLFVSFYTAFAVRSYPFPIQVTQPDGTTLSIIIRGDEFFHYTTTVGGKIIAQGADGFYYYASFDSGRMVLSSHRVSPYSPCPAGVSATSVPREFALQMRNFNKTLYPSHAPKKSVKTIIIPVQFSDVKFTVSPPRKHFEDMINLEGYSEDGATGSAKDYFKANLKDSLDFDFTVSDVVTLAKPLKYYGGNEETDTSIVRYDVNIKQFVIDACTAADAFVDFSLYNSVFIYYAGYSEAEGGGSDAIWPLSWNMNSSTLVLDGVRISSFACAAELKGAEGSSPSGIGTFCHEFGHVLGLLDLYDTDYEEHGQSKGLWGTLSLMDFGCYNNEGRTPPYFCAIDRELVGCIKEMKLEKDKSYTLKPINKNFEVYKVPTSNEGEYFLLEVRKESEWDAFIGGNGMVIYHVDKSSNVAGAITASVRWTTNTINTYSGHECADLVEANPSAVNVKQVFFPGISNVTSFTSLTTPPFAGWNLRNVGLKLTKIKNGLDGVSFDVSADNDERLLKVINPLAKAYQQEAYVSWSSDLDIQAKWGVRWKGKEKEDSLFVERIVSKKECRLDGLNEGKEYDCDIFYIGNNSNGDTVTVKIKTMEINSPFPFMYGVKSTYYIGDTLNLRLFNVLEHYNSIEWMVDGNKVTMGEFVFRSEGKRKISARITYSSDKSVEMIERIINIERKKDE